MFCVVVVGFAFVMSNAPALDVGRFACRRFDLKLVVVRSVMLRFGILGIWGFNGIVCFPPWLVYVLGVLGVRFLPIVGRSGFLALCVSVLACAVALAVDIRICCLCRSLSALLRVCEAYEVFYTVDCYVASQCIF